MADLEKSFRKMEKEVLKKMGKSEGEKSTKLPPYHKPKKINVRDLDDLLEESDFDEEEYLPRS